MLWSAKVPTVGERIFCEQLSRARIRKRLRSPGIDFKESISPAYVVRARICKPFKEPTGIDSARLHRLAEPIPWNRFLGSFNVYKYGLWRAGRATLFLLGSPIGCSKIPAQVVSPTNFGIKYIQ